MNISDAAREAYRLLQRTPSMSMPEAIQRGIDTATAALTLELETVKRERDAWKAQVENFGDPFVEVRQLRQQLAEAREDSKRLDWIERVSHRHSGHAPLIRTNDNSAVIWDQIHGLTKMGEDKTLRAAIDAAIKTLNPPTDEK